MYIGLYYLCNIRTTILDKCGLNHIEKNPKGYFWPKFDKNGYRRFLIKKPCFHKKDWFSKILLMHLKLLSLGLYFLNCNIFINPL